MDRNRESHSAPFVPSHSSTFNSLVPALPKPAGEEDNIIEVLIYSQSNLDAVLAKVKAEVKELDEKCDKLTQDNKEMGKIMEEKISLANDEIEHVRSKQKAETFTLQAQLRREQLKVCSLEKSLCSLEKSLEQKAKETEELTKLCDDLIANIQRL